MIKNLKGKDIYLFVDGAVVGGCTDCSFDGSAEMIPVAGNDAEWEEYECGRLSWGMSSSHLIDAGNAQMMLKVGTTIKVAIAENREDEHFSLMGDAIVKRAQIQAQHKDMCRGSFSFVGTGKLSATFGMDDEDGFLYSSDGFALVDNEFFYLDAEEEEGELFSSDGFALADFEAFYLETTEKE